MQVDVQYVLHGYLYISLHADLYNKSKDLTVKSRVQHMFIKIYAVNLAISFIWGNVYMCPGHSLYFLPPFVEPPLLRAALLFSYEYKRMIQRASPFPNLLVRLPFPARAMPASAPCIKALY